MSKGRRWPRRVLIGTNVIVALTLLATATTFGYVQYRLDQIGRVHVPNLFSVGSNAPTSQSRKPPGPAHSSPPFTTLVIGSDTRDLSTAVADAGDEQQVQGQRSDSIILLRVAPATRSLGILSIPRDTLAAIPGLGTTKINAAFDAGTPNLLVKVLAQDFGIQVNHVVEFNFDTFEDIADAIGGVYQYFPAPAMDAKSDLNIPKAGCVLLTGAQALAFARSRYYEYYLDGEWHDQEDPESDLGRIQRQQDFVKLAAKKAQRIAPTSPFALNKLISSLTTGIKLDTSFSNSLLLSLIKDYRNANLADIPSYTYPTTNDGAALDPDVALGKQTVAEWLDVGQTPPPTALSTTPATEPARTAATGPATSTAAVAPLSVTVEVVNGSGTAGQATLASRQLEKLGYQVTTGGNGAFDHPQTILDYAPDSLTAAQQLKTEISGPAVLTLDPSLAATPYNLEVVTGQNYTGMTSGTGLAASGPPASVPAATTTLPPLTDPGLVGSSTVQPDSSSFYKGQYIPPGREPGQIPQTCPD